MGKRANEIMSAMNLQKAKNSEYPDATPAVHLALAKAREQCAAQAASIAEAVGGDEEELSNMCLRNLAMVTPVLNSSYYVRKEIVGWDCRIWAKNHIIIILSDHLWDSVLAAMWLSNAFF